MKATITKSAFDKLSEEMQAIYKPEGDGYQATIDGLYPKCKVDEFRDSNIDLTNKLKAFDKVDLTKWDDMVKHEQQIADKKLIDAGEIDALVASKIEAVTSDFQAKLDNANGQITKLSDSNSNIVNKYEIQGATSKAFSEFKIRPEMQGALTSQINSMFTVKEGNVVAMDGDKIMTGKDGNLSINEFISTQPDIMKIPSSGGNGSGGGGDGGQTNKTPVDKIRAGLVKLAK